MKNETTCVTIKADSVCFEQEALMASILDKVHKYKISKGVNEGRYTTYVKDENKPSGRRQIKTKTLADMYKFLFDYYGIAREKEMLFSELWEQWIDYKKQFVSFRNNKGLSQSTIRRYERDYDKYIADSKLAMQSVTHITAIQLDTFIMDIIRKHSMKESCAKNIISYIHNVFGYAYRAEIIKADVSAKMDKRLILAQCAESVQKQDKDRVLTNAEREKLKIAIKKHEKNHIYYMPDYAIELALLTGMRVGEIAALRWSDIDDKNINIDFSEHRLDYKDKPCELIIGEPKNRKHRKIPLSTEMQNLFARIRALDIKSDFIFARKETGERYTAHDISCAIDRRAQEADIKKTSIHGIRRTVSSLLNEQIPQKAVASMLGHLETTNERYYNFDTHEDSEKIRALNTL